MSLSKLLRHVPKENHPSFRTDLFEYLCYFDKGEIAYIDGSKFAHDVIDVCAFVYEVNVEDMKIKKNSRQLNNAKMQSAFFLTKLERGDIWSSRMLEIKRCTLLYRKKKFRDLFETDAIFRSYFDRILQALIDKGYKFLTIDPYT